mmetsp:Transcript_16840/g.47222  ORF Transcript_16840/g.47222 Transcript_16840/m.47222 type:complete len:202 (+) Transcript_16840:2215-2820(+)
MASSLGLPCSSFGTSSPASLSLSLCSFRPRSFSSNDPSVGMDSSISLLRTLALDACCPLPSPPSSLLMLAADGVATSEPDADSERKVAEARGIGGASKRMALSAAVSYSDSDTLRKLKALWCVGTGTGTGGGAAPAADSASVMINAMYGTMELLSALTTVGMVFKRTYCCWLVLEEWNCWMDGRMDDPSVVFARRYCIAFS